MREYERDLLPETASDELTIYQPKTVIPTGANGPQRGLFEEWRDLLFADCA
jgi:hypothetical protein